MTVIRNINLDEIIELLSDIRKETGVVDMEVNEEEKTIVFVPIKKSEDLDISDQIKKMKEDANKNLNTTTTVPIQENAKINLTDLNKLI